MSRHLGSRGKRAPRKLWLVVLMIVLLGSLTPPALADHFPEEGPNVTAVPNTELEPEDQTITVQGSGFSGSGNEVSVSQCWGISDEICEFIGSADNIEGSFTVEVDVQYVFGEGSTPCDDPDCFVRATAFTEGGPEGDDASISFATDGQDSCVVGEGDEDGCTATTDNGVTGPDNPISVTMNVPAGAPPGLYTIRELPDPVANSKGAAEYTAPEGTTVLTITVSCDESQCKKKKLAILDKIVIVIKESPSGTEILRPCDLTIRIGRRVFHITNPPPCLDSVVRNPLNAPENPGDLVWAVDVLGGDPTIKGRG